MTNTSTQTRTAWSQQVYDQARQCYGALSVGDRQMLLMSYVDNLSTEEIACVVDLPQEEVMVRLCAAREQLRRTLRGALKGPHEGLAPSAAA